jgi:hypothetical protein
MRTLMTCLVLIEALLGLSCNSSGPTFETNGRPGRIGFKIELTDKSQLPFADSIATFLVPRFQAYADERKDFVLVKPNDSSDYCLHISVLSCRIVPYATQAALAQKRGKIEKKYDAINDSLNGKPPAEEAAKIVAANIAVNVISNAILLPMGFFSVAVITANDPYVAEPDRKEQTIIDSTFSTAHLALKARLTRNDGTTMWSDATSEKFKLTDVTRESEQIQVLSRNTILSLEDKVPFCRVLRSKR